MRRVADDFRLTVDFEHEQHVLHFGRSLGERDLEHDVRAQLGDGVVVTRDGSTVFLYTATREQADAVERVVRDTLAERQTSAEVSPLLRWHPVEERWEDASLPLPGTDTQVEAEHERFEAQQAEESRELGVAEWEVRVDLPSHRDAVKLAAQLDGEGIRPIVRRWKYLLIGTSTDDEARALAERIEAEAPAGATVTAEPSSAVAWELTADNPFAPFGAFGPGP